MFVRWIFLGFRLFILENLLLELLVFLDIFWFIEFIWFSIFGFLVMERNFGLLKFSRFIIREDEYFFVLYCLLEIIDLKEF